MAKSHSNYVWAKAKRAHVVIAEQALGKPMPVGAEVHHVDGDKSNNAPTNLVICQDHAYHMLLHIRQRVKDAGGDPNAERICVECKRVVPKTFFGRNANQCRRCKSEREMRRYHERAHHLSDNPCECGCGAMTFISGLTGKPSRFRSGHSGRKR